MAELPVTERRLQLAGVSSAVLEAGGGPPVLMLHGPGEFAALWALHVIEGARDDPFFEQPEAALHTLRVSLGNS